MRSRDLKLTLAGTLAVAMGAFAAHSASLEQRPEIGFGRPISERDLALWDIDIQTPSGANLPPGSGTVAMGQEVYAAKCLSCHGEAAKGGPVYGTMVGGIGTMDANPRVLTPGSMYPYAPILFDYVRRAMPMDGPQTLTNDEVYAVSAYLYFLNGLVPEDFEMNARTMPSIKMPNAGNFLPDNRPDTRAERCMTDCEPIGTVAEGEGQRTTNSGAAAGGGGTGGQVIMGTTGGGEGSAPGAVDKR